MILLSLAGTLGLVITVHRRTAPPRPGPHHAAAILQPSSLTESKKAKEDVVSLPPPAPAPPPAPKPPPPPPIDPTEQALARLTLAQTEQLVEAQVADRKAEALESARQAALARSEQARRREALIRTQIEALSDQAKRLETELDEVALERDVLARERDAAKAALAKARNRSSYAVLPHKGPNGTWRRPIIIECHNGQATLQPGGPSFSLLDLSMLLGPRSAPIVAAVAREAVRTQSLESPDGAPVVPYIFFVVRPDGIKPYYNARGQLEPLGIAFGYELVDQEMEIDYPDLDNLDEWETPISPRPGRSYTPGAAAARGSSDRPWPAPAPPPRGGGGRGPGDSPDTFVWPSHPELAAGGSGGDRGDGTSGGGQRSGAGDGYGTGGRGYPGSQEGSLPQGSSAPARNGLGRGGSGVDPLPLGTPLLDPANPYDNPGFGPSGLAPGGGAGGGPGPLPPASGRGGAPLPFAGTGGGGTSQPGQGSGPGLVTVAPEGMPNLEDPTAPGSGTGRSQPGPAAGGGWRAAGAPPSALAGGTPSTSGSPPPAASGSLPPLDPAGQTQGAGSLDTSPGSAQAGAVAGASAGGVGGNPGNLSSQGLPPGTPPSGNFNAASGGTPHSTPMLGQIAQLLGVSDSGVRSSDSGNSGQPSSSQPSSKQETQTPAPRSRSDLKKPMTIEVPFEVVVACGPEGAVLYPGGYRLSTKALKLSEGLLLRDLKNIVEARRQVDPTIRPRPSIRFLVEPGGGEAYREARRQTVLSGLQWPVAIQVADSDILDNLTPQEPF
jgi:hypothetical protein